MIFWHYMNVYFFRKLRGPHNDISDDFICKYYLTNIFLSTLHVFMNLHNVPRMSVQVSLPSTGAVTETWRGQVTCLGSHSKEWHTSLRLPQGWLQF